MVVVAGETFPPRTAERSCGLYVKSVLVVWTNEQKCLSSLTRILRGRVHVRIAMTMVCVCPSSEECALFLHCTGRPRHKAAFTTALAPLDQRRKMNGSVFQHPLLFPRALAKRPRCENAFTRF